MPRTPVNFDSAIKTLQEEHLPFDALQRTSARLRKPRRVTTLAPSLAGAAAILVGFAVFWPRQVNATWRQSIESTKNAPNIHRVERNKKGEITYELWQTGVKRSYYLRGRHGDVVVEQRFDGVRMFNYANFREPGQKLQTNEVICGHVQTQKGRWPEREGANEDLVSGLLKRPDIKVLSQTTIQTPAGERQRFRVRETFSIKWKGNKIAPPANVFDVEAEPESGRIRRVITGGGSYISEIDYPESIEETVFDPRPQMVSGIKVFDLDVERDKVSESIKKGLGAQQGVTLRLAALDSGGSLWVLWTGYLPDGALSRPFKLPGTKASNAYGLKDFTIAALKSTRVGASPLINQRIGGMSRTLFEKAMDRIDIDVPSKSGYAHFKAVPILRVNSIRDFSDLTGRKRTYYK